MTVKMHKTKKVTKNNLYTTTEWEWLHLQLRLYSIESRGTHWQVNFYLRDLDQDLVFKDTHAEVICRIYNKSVEQLFVDPRGELEKTFTGWVKWQKTKLTEYLSRLPALKKDFDIKRDFQAEIMQDYGMGASKLCHIKGGKVTWSAVGKSLMNEANHQ